MSRRRRGKVRSPTEGLRVTPFRPPRSESDPPFANPKCYAKCLNDCSPKMSGEHYFTYDILRKITKDPRGVFLRGVPWQPEGIWLQPESVTANILCERHNRALSPLDGFASALDDELHRILTAAERHQRVSTSIRFYGPNLERWLMKTLCGLACARPKQAFPDPSNAVIPDYWVRYLFSEFDLQPPAGLYLSGAIGERIPSAVDHFTIATMNANGYLAGVMVHMRMIVFTLLARPAEGRFAGMLNDQSIRRPRALSFQSARTEWRLEFIGPGFSGPSINYRVAVAEGAA
jgi:hypothetical protein